MNTQLRPTVQGNNTSWERITVVWLEGYSKVVYQYFKRWHGASARTKGFVIPTKSFVKIGITKIFCYNNKMFGYINKTFGCWSKIFGCSNKKLFVVPNFVAVTKPFFSMNQVLNDQLRPYDYSQLISLKMPRNKSYEYFNWTHSSGLLYKEITHRGKGLRLYD